MPIRHWGDSARHQLKSLIAGVVGIMLVILFIFCIMGHEVLLLLSHSNLYTSCRRGFKFIGDNYTCWNAGLILSICAAVDANILILNG